MPAAAALVASVVTAAPAVAFTGTVTHVDPIGSIVYLADGRTVKLEPGATVTVNGRQFAVRDLKPGMQVEFTEREGASPLSAARPPVDAAGTVASFDPATGILTFQDGRMFRVTQRSSVWQQGERSAVKPGEQVLLRSAEAVGYRRAWNAADSPRHRMGTVASVDPVRSVIVLTDGTVVRITPQTRMALQNQPITIADIKPGDECVIVGTSRQAARDADSGGMASPRQDIGSYGTITFDASEVHLMRRPQAP